MTTFDRIRIVAALVMIAAAWLVPWTTFSDPSAHVSLSYHAGKFEWPLTAMAVAILVVQTIRDRGAVRGTYPLLLGLVMLIGAISAVTALSNMSHANANTGTGFQQSQWSYGIFLAVVAFVLFLAATLSEQPRRH
ncbi:MAG: hypothetical protein HIU57_02220 [Acidobacteria bacterium]|nr:hypothetical protein [Acidobacteriota bacterium]